jgi:hypothetical protein
MGRLLRFAGLGAAFLLYVWVAAARSARQVRAGKAARRAARSS